MTQGGAESPEESNEPSAFTFLAIKAEDIQIIAILAVNLCKNHEYASFDAIDEGLGMHVSNEVIDIYSERRDISEYFDANGYLKDPEIVKKFVSEFRSILEDEQLVERIVENPQVGLSRSDLALLMK